MDIACQAMAEGPVSAQVAQRPQLNAQAGREDSVPGLETSHVRPAQGSLLEASQRSCAGGGLRGTAESLASVGVEVGGTGATLFCLPVPCSSTLLAGVLHPQLRIPQEQSVPALVWLLEGGYFTCSVHFEMSMVILKVSQSPFLLPASFPWSPQGFVPILGTGSPQVPWTQRVSPVLCPCVE